MSLSCSCGWDVDDYDTAIWVANDYKEYPSWRGQRCCSEGCDSLVRKGDICLEIKRTRAGTEWEDIRGIAAIDDPEAIQIASHYMCERCADLFFSFEDLGFECVSPYENMIELAKEYHDNYQLQTKIPAEAGTDDQPGEAGF